MKFETYQINGKLVKEPRSYALLWLALLVVLTYFAFQLTDFDWALFIDNAGNFWNILFSMFPPKWEFADKIWQPIIETVQMSVLGSFTGAIVAVPFAMLAAHNITPNRAVNFIFKFFLSLLRTLPTLVSALIATFVFGIGATAGMVAIFLFSLAYVGKLMYEHIENVDMGPYEALMSMGLNRVEAFYYALVPPLLPTYLSIVLFNFEGNIRYSAVLGYVGAGGIGQLINKHISLRDYGSVGMILFALMVLVYIIETISQHFRARLTKED